MQTLLLLFRLVFIDGDSDGDGDDGDNDDSDGDGADDVYDQINDDAPCFDN